MRSLLKALLIVVLLQVLLVGIVESQEVVKEENKMGQKIREPGFAGSWYPGDPATLRKAVSGYINNASKAEISGKIVMLIAPHAGYVYSGPVAGYSFKQVEGNSYDTVVCIGLSHRVRINTASIFDGDIYRTPLGDVPIDKELVKTLRQSKDVFEYVKEAHDTSRSVFGGGGEHSVELEVPFLQVALKPGFKMVEILLNNENPSFLEKLGDTLSKALEGKNFLIVVSTDMSHFPPVKDAKRVDGLALKAVETMDVPYMIKRFNELEREPVPNLSCIFCGKAGVLAGIIAAKNLGADKAKILKYDCSDADGTGSRAVGYGSVAIYQSNGNPNKNEEKMESSQAPENNNEPEPLTSEQRAYLIDLAHKSVEAAAAGKPIPKIVCEDPVLLVPRGAFVTLKKKGDLRGCIGNFQPEYPLYMCVLEMARSAAIGDPRFPKVRPEEVPELTVDITVFPPDPLRKINDISEIEIGKHGLYIKRGFSRGTLLPQVATEYNWDVKTFLEHTCRKAGLPINAWKEEGTEIFVYPGEVFGETE